jgi:hypothetical protein
MAVSENVDERLKRSPSGFVRSDPQRAVSGSSKQSSVASFGEISGLVIACSSDAGNAGVQQLKGYDRSG